MMNRYKYPHTISNAVDNYLESVTLSRSANTAKAYGTGMDFFLQILRDADIQPETQPVSVLDENAISWLIIALKDYAPATERLYINAVKGFYEYVAAEELTKINLPRVRLLIKQRSRRTGQRLPQFPRDSIDEILEKIDQLKNQQPENEMDHLINMRDRAFLITLADTGLRVHEACNLRRGDIDWNEGRAIIIGKGDKQAVVRFSARSMAAIKEYLKLRAILDGSSKRPLISLPIFARHDKGTGKNIKPITTTTGRNIVTARVRQFLGEDLVGKITPHSFRHYFVTRVLQASGNLKLAQELARHSNIAVTQRYAHLSDDELDQGYWEIFKEK